MVARRQRFESGAEINSGRIYNWKTEVNKRASRRTHVRGFNRGALKSGNHPPITHAWSESVLSICFLDMSDKKIADWEHIQVYYKQFHFI